MWLCVLPVLDTCTCRLYNYIHDFCIYMCMIVHAVENSFKDVRICNYHCLCCTGASEESGSSSPPSSWPSRSEYMYIVVVVSTCTYIIMYE